MRHSQLILWMDFFSVTLNQVDVTPPELHWAQKLFSIFLQPSQKPVGTFPELPPTAEFLSFSQTLCTSTKNKQCLNVIKTSDKIELISGFYSSAYLSRRFWAMGLLSSRMGFSSSFCFSSCLLMVFTSHFPLLDEPRRPLLLCLRLLPPVVDFLLYRRDW